MGTSDSPWFQGMLRADPKQVGTDKNELFGLWMHENLRAGAYRHSPFSST
jgi:hypothetical protein